jgi:hypothetical protein
MSEEKTWWESDWARGTSDDRRATARHPATSRASCRLLGGCESWPARVRDVSTLGAGLLLPRPVGMGTLLQIDFEGTTIDIARTVLGRVVHVTAEGTDWLTGCAFVSELDDATLRLFQASRIRTTSGDARRWVRFPCKVETICYSVDTAPGEQRPARILNISAGGMGLLLPCQYEAGTLLALDLGSLTGRPDQPLLLRVLRSVGHVNGDWFHGCEFADQLDDDELQALL